LGTLLKLVVASLHFSTYWPRQSAPPSSTLELDGTWQQYLVLVSVALLLVGAGFLFGYLGRGKKNGNAIDPEEVKNDVLNLETEIRNARRALDELLINRGRKPRKDPAGKAAVVSGAGWQGRPGFLKRIANYFNAVDEPKAPHPLVTQLRQLRQSVKSIKEDIADAAPSVTTSQPRVTMKGDERRRPYYGMFTPTGDNVQDDASRRTKSATNDASGARPTIGSHYHDERMREAQRFPVEGGASGYAIPNVWAEIVELYNRAVTEPSSRERLRERYQAVRVGTVNAVERRQNPTIKAEYREASDGDFLAYPVGRDEYIVVPSLGLTIESVGYTAGALGEVFKNTQGYDPQRFYSSYRVRQPAIFRCDGDHWELCSPGELDLGPGD
jgi:hypothetical protein